VPGRVPNTPPSVWLSVEVKVRKYSKVNIDYNIKRMIKILIQKLDQRFTINLINSEKKKALLKIDMKNHLQECSLTTPLPNVEESSNICEF
jgi:hypothetical protein